MTKARMVRRTTQMIPTARPKDPEQTYYKFLLITEPMPATFHKINLNSILGVRMIF